MSSIAYVRMKVDLRLRQMDTKNRSYSVPEVDQAIREKYIAKQASMPPAHVAELAAFTIPALTKKMALPLWTGTYSDALDLRFQIVRTGGYLIKRNEEEVQAFDAWQPNAAPTDLATYALWEDDEGKVWIRFPYATRVEEMVNVYRSKSHEAPFSATDLDAADIFMNEAACAALAADVAADLVLALPDEELIKRRLNRKIADVWHQEAARVWYQEDARRSDLMSTGRQQRWVS